VVRLTATYNSSLQNHQKAVVFPSWLDTWMATGIDRAELPVADNPHLLVLGCGYVGQAVAREALASHWQVTATTRSDASAYRLESSGIRAVVFDWTRDPVPSLDTPTDAVLITVSHHVAPGQNAMQVHPEGLAHCLPTLARSARRCIYLSTTGVYGQKDLRLATSSSSPHRWVDESSPVDPDRPGAINAAAGEKWMRESDLAGRSTILRLAGIYGPYRTPNLQKLRAGEAIEVNPEGFLNLIHRDDIARVILDLLRHPSPKPLYCVSDGHPVTRSDYYRWIAEQQGLPSPIFAPPHDPRSEPSRRSGSKRIDPRLLMEDTGKEFRFPSYREGLLHSWREEFEENSTSRARLE
jgi:nucleoside-diphosphate-sugar epimerase